MKISSWEFFLTTESPELKSSLTRHESILFFSLHLIIVAKCGSTWLNTFHLFSFCTSSSRALRPEVLKRANRTFQIDIHCSLSKPWMLCRRANFNTRELGKGIWWPAVHPQTAGNWAAGNLVYTFPAVRPAGRPACLPARFAG